MHGRLGRMHIEPFKRRAQWLGVQNADKQLQVISTIMLYKNSCSTKELKGANEQRRVKLKAILY